jgi:hypothetical protein
LVHKTEVTNILDSDAKVLRGGLSGDGGHVYMGIYFTYNNLLRCRHVEHKSKIISKMLTDIQSALDAEQQSVSSKHNILLNCEVNRGKGFLPGPSPLRGAYQPIWWYSLTPYKLDCTKVSDTVLHYEIPGDVAPVFKYLAHTSMSLPLPRVNVRPEFSDNYRISWTRHIDRVAVSAGHLIAGKLPFSYFDLHSNMAHGAFNDVHRNEYTWKRDSGNVPELMAPQLELVPWTIACNHPWTYTRSSTTCFPLFLNKSGILTHVYTDLRLKISELIRMRQRVNGKWIDVPTDINVILVDGDTCVRDQRLATPEVWGMFANDVECGIEKLAEQIPTEYQVRDFVSMTAVKLAPGSPAEIGLSNVNGVAKCTYLLAENRESHKFSNYTNYTSKIEGGGVNPITTVSMWQNEHPKFTNLPTHMLSGEYARRHFASSPEEEGFNVIPRSFYPDDVCNDVGIDPSKIITKISCCTRDDIKPNTMYLRAYSAIIRTLDFSEMQPRVVV